MRYGNITFGNNLTLTTSGNGTFSGTVQATNVNSTSDKKFKTNITPAKPQLDQVVALGSQLKDFDWKDNAPLNDELRSKRQIGLIAQEVELICPELIGKSHHENEDYKTISQTGLIMKLLGAVAELKAEVDSLKQSK